MTPELILKTTPLLFIMGAMIVSWRSFSRRYPKVLQEFAILCTISFVVELAGHILSYFQVQNPLLYNIYFMVWFLVLVHVYQQQLEINFIRKLITGFYIFFPLLGLWNILFFQDKNWLQTLTFVTGGCFMIFLTLAYFWQLYVSDNNEKITRDPFFWFSFGYLVLFGGQVPFIGMLNYLYSNFPEFTRTYYLYFSNSFAIFLYVLIMVGYLCRTNYQR